MSNQDNWKLNLSSVVLIWIFVVVIKAYYPDKMWQSNQLGGLYEIWQLPFLYWGILTKILPYMVVTGKSLLPKSLVVFGDQLRCLQINSTNPINPPPNKFNGVGWRKIAVTDFEFYNTTYNFAKMRTRRKV